MRTLKSYMIYVGRKVFNVLCYNSYLKSGPFAVQTGKNGNIINIIKDTTLYIFN